MAKKKTIIAIVVILGIIYLPGFLKLQQLREENRNLGKGILELKNKNEELKKEIHRLQTDLTYVEGVAREKLKKAKKGEIIYRTE